MGQVVGRGCLSLMEGEGHAVGKSASAVMSTFKRSEMGPSSSTFQREDRSDVKLSQSEPGPS
eukprot:6208243-Pleurochrysis_carterae.AAC.1